MGLGAGVDGDFTDRALIPRPCGQYRVAIPFSLPRDMK
jgi:hypothetical protein